MIGGLGRMMGVGIRVTGNPVGWVVGSFKEGRGRKKFLNPFLKKRIGKKSMIKFILYKKLSKDRWGLIIYYQTPCPLTPAR